jgi:DNA-binding NarL/FixJ family response regulator
MALWLHRAGDAVDTAGLPEPFALEIAGNGCAAAGFWRQLGSSLAAARALASTGAEEDLRAAFDAFEALGARADAARVARQLREMGARHVPRGARPATRANAGRLTARELEILGLLATGSSNREIADRLYLSPKTVGHHVSSILAKLDVASRAEAVERAGRMGMLQPGEALAPE